MELKLKTNFPGSFPGRSFNRTRMELKRADIDRIRATTNTFNRTRMELKLVEYIVNNFFCLAFNRTRMELKPGDIRKTFFQEVFF